jgi:hypothetical protein
MTTKRGGARGRRPLPETERKDRLVQTRVPEDLDQTLRQEARRNRVSVSQLIRNVLEDTFDLVDDVVAEASSLGRAVTRDAKRIAASARGRRRAPDAAPAIDAVFAWQEAMPSRDVECARCGRLLRKGKKAQFGLQEDARAPRVWLCLACAAVV